MIMLIILIK